MKTPQEILDRYYHTGWNKGNESVIKECVAENVKLQLAFDKRRKRGHEGLLEYMRSVRNSIDKHCVEIEDIVVNAEGTRASVLLKNRGLHKNSFFGVEGSGIEIVWAATAFISFADERITEIWVLADLDSVKRQIGADPKADPFSN
jgi:steroid delta-isomerase-like uncharacterized protein